MPITRPLAAVASLLFVTSAGAQSSPPNDQSLDILIFEPALGSHSFLTVAAAETMSKGQFQLAVGVSYMTKPLSVYLVDKSDANALTTRADVIDSMVTGHVSFAYAIRQDLQLGLLLPAIFSMKGDGLDPTTGMPEAGGLSVSGLGDLRIEANWRVYERTRMVLSVIPAVTIPISTKLGSDQSSFLGDSLPTFRPRVAWEWTSSNAKLNVGANLGLIIRKPRTVYSSDVGQQLTYGLAAAYHVTRRFDLIGELFGRKGFSLDMDESPLEIDGALRLGITPALAVQAGGGAGLIKGVGAPGVRLFAAVSWAPDYGDADGDGIPNQDDMCPLQPEDKDGFEDSDGCPDLDNDGDGIPDDQDKCPNEKEDFDGFQDEDGCPDPDNDKDGIPDESDACPNEPEDHLPPLPNDGCPQDKTEENSSTPAPAGTPGAPFADADHDGVADKDDKCPDQPETVNGVKDDDGCPDAGGHVLARLAGIEVVLARPLEFEGARLRTAGRAVLDQAAILMRSQTHLIGKWRVTLTPERRWKAQGAAQAEAVKAYLVTRGLPATAIDVAVGEGQKPVVKIEGTARPDGTPLTDTRKAPPADEPKIEIVP